MFAAFLKEASVDLVEHLLLGARTMDDSDSLEHHPDDDGRTFLTHPKA
jgi:hypothetical protein